MPATDLDGPWRIGPEVGRVWGTATTLAGAAKARTDIGANIGADPRQLKIWLVGFCKFGRWVVGPVEDRPPPSRDPEGWEWPGSSGGWGRMGFMADTLHEALVLRHAAEGARVWGGVVYPPGGHSLAIWQAGSQRRLTQDGLLKGLEAEALAGSPELRAALSL